MMTKVQAYLLSAVFFLSSLSAAMAKLETQAPASVCMTSEQVTAQAQVIEKRDPNFGGPLVLEGENLKKYFALLATSVTDPKQHEQFVKVSAKINKVLTFVDKKEHQKVILQVGFVNNCLFGQTTMPVQDYVEIMTAAGLSPEIPQTNEDNSI